MSEGNGVIRIGRKGVKKFAFGEDGDPFEVDVVTAFQQWIAIDDQLRQSTGDDAGKIRLEDMPTLHEAAVQFVQSLMPHAITNDANGAQIRVPPEITTAEALDFIARLREQYDELADFFLPRKRGALESPATSGVELQYSASEEPSATSTN